MKHNGGFPRSLNRDCDLKSNCFVWKIRKFKDEALDDQKWLQKWLRIRKELYRQMEAEVSHRLGRESADLVLYRRDYENEFAKKWQAAPKEELMERILASRWVLMGDFHALQQSQKAALRILKALPAKTKIVLALECVDAKNQAALDKYVQGKGGEREFLKNIQWQERWGFPWEHYKPLFRWAQQNKVKIYGLNREVKKYSAASLQWRDQFAAEKIHEILEEHPNAICFTLFGDLHLAKNHLPHEVFALQGGHFKKNSLRIFQNAEKIYFQLLAKEMESSVDVVRLSHQDYCLLSVPPWVKWQNYLMYLEQAYDLELQDEDMLDYTDHISRYVKILSEELGVNISLDRLSVYTARDPLLWQKVAEKFQGRELKWVEQMIEEGGSFYLPELGLAYLARASVNHAASLAMQYVHAETSGRKRFSFEMPADFTRQIWIEAMAYFGSKLINPKRKTDTIADIKASLASRQAVEMGKEVLMLSLAQKMQELMMISQRPRPRGLFTPKKKWSYMQSAALLGGILGERLYAGYRKKLISTVTLVGFLKKDTDAERFENVYYEMLEIIEAMPTPFKSKKEKL